MNTFKELIATMVIDNLDSNSTQSSLSARCGKILADKEKKDFADLNDRLTEVETWITEVLAGNTALLVEDTSASTTGINEIDSNIYAINATVLDDYEETENSEEVVESGSHFESSELSFEDTTSSEVSDV